MIRKHSVIFVPGLSGTTSHIANMTEHWRNHGLYPIMHPVPWRDRQTDFRLILESLIDHIDECVARGEKVSIVGTSAGGSAALNAFIDRHQTIHKVVLVCARLKVGPTTGFRSFASKTATSQSFAESVFRAESMTPNIGENERRRIMTVRSLFGDELVPASTSTIEGARNITVPVPEHMLSIAASLTLFSSPLIQFLNNE